MGNKKKEQTLYLIKKIIEVMWLSYNKFLITLN